MNAGVCLKWIYRSGKQFSLYGDEESLDLCIHFVGDALTPLDPILAEVHVDTVLLWTFRKCLPTRGKCAF